MTAQHKQEIRRAAILAVAFVSICAFFATLAIDAHGSPVCRNCFRPQQQVYAPAVQKVFLAQPDYHYAVGASIRQDAANTYQMQSTGIMADYARLQGFEQAVKMLAEQQAAESPVEQQPPAYYQQQQAEPAAPATDVPPRPEPGAAASPTSNWRQVYPATAAACLKCHDGSNDKTDMVIDQSRPIAGEFRDEVVHVALTGETRSGVKMPPPGPVSEQTMNAIVSEVHTVTAQEAPAQAPQQVLPGPAEDVGPPALPAVPFN